MSKTESSALTALNGGESEADLIEHYRQSLETLRSQGFCVYGQYPWDFWEKRARTRGVPQELAGLGRALMREADQHLWEPKLQTLCGWADEGEAMIRLALSAPERAVFMWRQLLDTDGCRGCYDAETGQWISWL
jgi:hypothetical protein